MTGRKTGLLIQEKRQDQPLFDHVFSESFSIHLPFCGGMWERWGMGSPMVPAKKNVPFRLVARKGQRVAGYSDQVHGMDLNHRVSAGASLPSWERPRLREVSGNSVFMIAGLNSIRE